MSNPFKKLDSATEQEQFAPPSLKTKVVGTYGMLLSTLKVLELFVGNLSTSIMELARLYEEGEKKQQIQQNETAQNTQKTTKQ